MKHRHRRLFAILLLVAFAVLQARVALAACVGGSAPVNVVHACCEAAAEQNEAPCDGLGYAAPCVDQCIQAPAAQSGEKDVLFSQASSTAISRSASSHLSIPFEPLGPPPAAGPDVRKTSLIYFLQRLLI